MQEPMAFRCSQLSPLIAEGHQLRRLFSRLFNGCPKIQICHSCHHRRAASLHSFARYYVSLNDEEIGQCQSSGSSAATQAQSGLRLGTLSLRKPRSRIAPNCCRFTLAGSPSPVALRRRSGRYAYDLGFLAECAAPAAIPFEPQLHPQRKCWRDAGRFLRGLGGCVSPRLSLPTLSVAQPSRCQRADAGCAHHEKR